MGRWTLQANGAFSYVGEQDFIGTDQFSYRLTDGVDSSAPAVVTLIVQSVNDPPVAIEGQLLYAAGVTRFLLRRIAECWPTTATWTDRF